MKRIQYLVYRVIRFLVKLFYPKTTVVGLANLPQEPCVVVGNHSQMHGPIACELYFPGDRAIWCTGEMMHMKDVPDYAFQDFWRNKPKSIRWFFRILSYIIAPLSVCIFTNAHTIGVYRDKRILSTYRDTLKRLKEGANIIIFPEHDAPYNSVLCDFQDGFVDVAKQYWKQTGKCLRFVPMYLAPALRTMYLGEPIAFCPDNSIKEERQRICTHLKEEISSIAYDLPKHRVVPYNNVSKKDYNYNIPGGSTHEEVGC